HQTESRIDGAPQADDTGLAVLRLKPGRIELVVYCGRAEVPKNRIPATREEDPARELVARPFTDLGRGYVADVVFVKQQWPPDVGRRECGLRRAETVAMHTAVGATLFKVDAHCAEHRQVAAPVIARVDGFGGDLHRVARSLIHGRRLTQYLRYRLPAL